MAHTIVKIDHQGRMTMEVVGAAGKSCEKLTQPYLDRLGIPLDKVQRELHVEYMQEIEQHLGHE